MNLFPVVDNDSQRNWMPKQKMWRVDDDHSLQRMQFEAAFYGLERDRKYPMQQLIYDWYGWQGYFSWRDLPRDCSQLMGLYVFEIHRMARQLKDQPARCVSILLRADQEAIVPVRVEQAGAIFAILKTQDDPAGFLEIMQTYIETRPDFKMSGAAFSLTEVGAANFCMKMIASGLIPGFTGWYDISQQRIMKDQSNARNARSEQARNLLSGLVFEGGDDD